MMNFNGPPSSDSLVSEENATSNSDDSGSDSSDSDSSCESDTDSEEELQKAKNVLFDKNGLLSLLGKSMQKTFKDSQKDRWSKFHQGLTDESKNLKKSLKAGNMGNRTMGNIKLGMLAGLAKGPAASKVAPLTGLPQGGLLTGRSQSSGNMLGPKTPRVVTMT